MEREEKVEENIAEKEADAEYEEVQQAEALSVHITEKEAIPNTTKEQVCKLV